MAIPTPLAKPCPSGPVVISTPLKLLLFVMVDGWNLVIGSLMRSFN